MENFTLPPPSVHPATEDDRVPWGSVTEGAWTWFFCTIFTLLFLALAHLKYKKKMTGRPKNLTKEKNEIILERYLLAHQKAARTKLPDGTLSVEEFMKSWEERKKYPVIYKIEFSSVKSSQERTEKPSSKEGSLDVSFLPGLIDGKDYLVSQGPMEDTVDDLWGIVWNNNCPVIVMLTKTFDYTRIMCVQYWPSRTQRRETHGDLEVRLLSEHK